MKRLLRMTFAAGMIVATGPVAVRCQNCGAWSSRSAVTANDLRRQRFGQ